MTATGKWGLQGYGAQKGAQGAGCGMWSVPHVRGGVGARILTMGGVIPRTGCGSGEGARDRARSEGVEHTRRWAWQCGGGGDVCQGVSPVVLQRVDRSMVRAACCVLCQQLGAGRLNHAQAVVTRTSSSAVVLPRAAIGTCRTQGMLSHGHGSVPAAAKSPFG